MSAQLVAAERTEEAANCDRKQDVELAAKMAGPRGKYDLGIRVDGKVFVDVRVLSPSVPPHIVDISFHGLPRPVFVQTDSALRLPADGRVVDVNAHRGVKVRELRS